ncbi:hypothetical protein U1Q18_017524, partial [Sarracenia purpurea var. burkii]
HCYSGVANPSERQPQQPTFEDNMDLSKEKAIAECRGIKESPLPNSTGILVEKKGWRWRERRGEEGTGFDGGASPPPEATEGGDWVLPLRLRKALADAVDL